MPHFGQSPGVADSTPGHMEQKYLAADEGLLGELGSIMEMCLISNLNFTKASSEAQGDAAAEAVFVMPLADEGEVFMQEILGSGGGFPASFGVILGAAKDGEPGGDGENFCRSEERRVGKEC